MLRSENTPITPKIPRAEPKISTMRIFTKRSEYTKFMTETELLVTREGFPMRPKNQVVSRNCFVSMMKDAYGEKFNTPIAADSLDARMVSYSVNAWNKCEDKTAQVKSGAYVTMANRF